MKTFEERVNEAKPSLVVFVHAHESDTPEIEGLTQQLTAKYGDKVNFMRVDASIDDRLKRQYDILKYPTWVLLKSGQELMRETGDKTLNELTQLVERAL